MACGDVCHRCHGAAPVGAPCSLCGPGPSFTYTSDRTTPEPIYLSADDLPTSVDLRMVHWGLELGLRGGRTVEEARLVEALLGPSTREQIAEGSSAP